MQLSKIGEFGLIKNLKAKCAQGSSTVLKGIGDDTAVLKSLPGKTLVTSDMMIEKTHFDLDFTSFSQLGHKFLAVNVSDILSMGGTPRYFFISIGIPDGFKSRDIKELYTGILKVAGRFNIIIAGGDTCSSPEGLILSGTLIGSCNRPITRSGAIPGDYIYIQAATGDSAMGLSLLKKMKRKAKKFLPASTSSRLINKHLTPNPEPLRSLKGITSMIDISDGLLIDLSHICDESNVGAVLYEEKIPLSNDLSSVAEKVRVNPLDLALKGGEDYTLLFTSPNRTRKDAYKIGEITDKGRFIISKEGKKKKLKPEGYEHFKGNR